MADWMLQAGGGVEACIRGTATTVGVQPSPSASANVKGGWSDLIAATTADWVGFYFSCRASAQRVRCLIDIAVGAGGSEQVLVSNLAIGSWNIAAHGDTPLLIPVAVAAGSRLSCRVQTDPGGVTAGPILYTLGLRRSERNVLGFGRGTTYGADTSTSGGTVLDAGGSVNTKGAWTQLTASTANPMRAFLVLCENPAIADLTHTQFFLDLAIGAGGSEQIVVADMPLNYNQAYTGTAPSALGPYYADIPAGTRLAARLECNDATATRRIMGVSLLGLD